MNKIIVFTDGSSRGNPGPGGWAAIILEKNNSEQPEHVREIGGREKMTTNNKMEMTAAIQALKNIPENSEIKICTDSEYLMKGITGWIENWQKNNWRTKDKREVLNRKLWEELLAETKIRKVKWEKVAGHSGHGFNDRCDEIATDFADGLKVDLYDGPMSGYKFHNGVLMGYAHL